jgi:hypothetical protein
MLPTDVSISVSVLIALLAGCAAEPVAVRPTGESSYTLHYVKLPVDTVPHMRRQLTQSAREVCPGGYTERREYPDPTVVPSRELVWDIECGNT